MYGAEPRYNDLLYNDIPSFTMGMSLTERKMFPVITIKSISQTTVNTNLLLAECEVRTASYENEEGKNAGHENEEGKNEDP